MIEEAVREHYTRLLGRQFEVRRLEASAGARDEDVDVLKWDAGSNPNGVHMYATLGASRHPVPGHDDRHRIEAYIGLLPDADEALVREALAEAAMHHVLYKTQVGAGDTMTFPEPLWPGTEMRTLWLRRPLREDILPPLRLPKETVVEFLMAVPLFERELLALRRLGEAAFMKQWAELGIPFHDPFRSAAVP